MTTAQMDIQAQIYQQTQRGIARSAGYQGYYTLNFEGYQSENREPVGDLLAWNDETLGPEKSHRIHVDQPTRVILMPLAGALEIERGNDREYVSSGETMGIVLQAGEDCILTNPYPDHAVNYLQIRLLIPGPLNTATLRTTFDLNEKNSFLPVFQEPDERSALVIGKFNGREEGIYFCRKSPSDVFVFIIEGAFEVQNRLLETRDALALQNIFELEFEALSNDAIILILE